jgi:hypothetical protein
MNKSMQIQPLKATLHRGANPWALVCGSPDNPLDKCAKNDIDDRLEQDQDDKENDAEKSPRDYPQDFDVTLRDVDDEFFESSSNATLIEALLEFVDELDLTLLSYTCHSMESTGGLCCSAIVYGGDIMMFTVPKHKVLCVYMMTSEYHEAKELLVAASEVFEIGVEDITKWGLVGRAFAPLSDLDLILLSDGTMEYKMQVCLRYAEFGCYETKANSSTLNFHLLHLLSPGCIGSDRLSAYRDLRWHYRS